MQYKTQIKKLPKSQIEMEVSIEEKFLAEAREKAISVFSLSLEIPGFRKGHLPKNIVIEKIGETALLEEAADILLKEHFPKIITEEKIDIIGSPNINITKLALGNPFEFKALFAVLPSFELPNYKEIASKENKKETKIEEVSEKEIEDVLLQIRKNKAHLDWHQKNHEANHHNHPDLEKEENLPALDDELAKAAGNFKNLAELKEKIKENILIEKKNKITEKRRAAIMEALIKETEIDLPDILIESETNKSLAQMKDDIARMKGQWQEYLTHIKKTEEDLKKDLRESSEKKAKIQLIFNKIAEAEKIELNKEILEQETKNIMENYKEASETNVRIYVSTILLNTEVLKILESA